MSDPVASSAPIPPPHLPPGPIRRLFYGRDGLRALWSVVLFVIVVFVTSVIVLAVVNLGLALLFHNPTVADLNLRAVSPRLIALSSYPFVVGLLIGTIVLARSERRSPWSYGLAAHHAPRLFAAGAAWGFLALSALIGLLAITGHITVGGPTNPPLVALRFAGEWALAFLGVGLFEETAARGYLQGRLSRAIGFWPAAVLLSILFGAGHVTNSGETATGLIGAGTVGLMFCYSLWRSGSLWWAIGFHAAWDWAQSYFYGTHDSGMVSAGSLLTSRPTGADWLSGGTAGPEGSALVFVVLIAVVFVIRWTLTAKPLASTAGVTAPHS
jgi:membrane protease YdiL (CAAX protease family)